jgi:hypothetical protein
MPPTRRCEDARKKDVVCSRGQAYELLKRLFRDISSHIKHLKNHGLASRNPKICPLERASTSDDLS